MSDIWSFLLNSFTFCNHPPSILFFPLLVGLGRFQDAYLFFCGHNFSERVNQSITSDSTIPARSSWSSQSCHHHTDWLQSLHSAVFYLEFKASKVFRRMFRVCWKINWLGWLIVIFLVLVLSKFCAKFWWYKNITSSIKCWKLIFIQLNNGSDEKLITVSIIFILENKIEKVFNFPVPRYKWWPRLGCMATPEKSCHTLSWFIQRSSPAAGGCGSWSWF